MNDTVRNDTVGSARQRAVPDGGPPAQPVEAARAPTLGLLPLLAVTTAVGLLLVAVADARSRSLTSNSQVLFWLGLILIFAPTAGRLAQAAPQQLERLSLAVLLGLSLYAVKVFRDPFGFTFADELAHAPNAQAILRTHHLFHANAVLRATPFYPGLESVTAGLASLSGLSAYGAGLIVIGVARLVIVVALFLLVARLLGSARAGGIAVAVYAANSNFVYFSAQFSYESLALPLFVAALFAYAEWRQARVGSRPTRLLYAASTLLLTFAVVTTHHITSYALAVTFAAITLGYYAFGSRPQSEAPAAFAVFAIVASSAWLVVVASATVGYLSPVLSRAIHSIAQTVSGERAPRKLFSSGTAGSGAGSGAAGRITALAGAAVFLALFPAGASEAWRRYRRDPLAIAMTVAGGLVFVAYLLRFAPDAWETANRSTEFLFLGLAVAIPLGIFRLEPRLRPRTFVLATAAALTLAFAGGVVSGWTPSLRLAQPYELKEAGHVIPAEGRAMASWALRSLGTGRQIVAPDADARLLNTYAGESALGGQHPDFADLLRTTDLQAWELPLLRKNHIRYVVVDRRVRASNNLSGYFFGARTGPRADQLLPSSVVNRFHRFDRIFDSGDIVIFDLGSR